MMVLVLASVDGNITKLDYWLFPQTCPASQDSLSAFVDTVFSNILYLSTILLGAVIQITTILALITSVTACSEKVMEFR